MTEDNVQFKEIKLCPKHKAFHTYGYILKEYESGNNLMMSYEMYNRTMTDAGFDVPYTSKSIDYKQFLTDFYYNYEKTLKK